jgi:D-alanyl-lipoteichoic acid acyltransferase DltB (MBOAT superfamily)
MLFHSPLFLLFFLPLVFFSYFFILKKYENLRVYLLIAAGFVFYAAWNIKLSPLIVITILVNFYFGKKIINISGILKKKKILFFSILFNIVFLAFFKYSDFIILNINSITNSNIELLNLPFPLALSFVTFQTIAYLVDCYDGNILKHNIKKYSLFIIFFPQLIAGPIVRYNNMISQFEDKKNALINYKNIYIGLVVIAIGLAKKILIADNLSVIVDQGFNLQQQLSFLESWLVSISFTFQIYFDFSGYIDMATGIALLFNINLPRNFDSPFKASGIINFWQRWHITLSTFLTNYIYFPISRSLNELTFIKSMIITMVVFLIAGLWHGPSWLFIAFGGLHGLGLVVNHSFRKISSFRLNKIFSQFITFNFVNFTLIFFRAESFESSANIIKGMFVLKDINGLVNIFTPTNSIIAFVASFLICFLFKNTHYIIEQLNKSKSL